MEIVGSTPTLAQSVPSPRPTPLVPAGYRRTIKHNRFAISIGSHRVAFERVQERYTMASGAVEQARSGKLLLGIATVGLFTAYVALLPSPSPASRYSAELTIPDKAVAARASLPIARVHARHTLHLAAAAKPQPIESDQPAPTLSSPVTVTTIDASLDQPASADIVDMPSDAGERSLAVLGPARQVGGRTCRDVQIFSRDATGKVSVEPTTRCGKL